MGIVAVPVLFQSVFCFSVSGSFWSHLDTQCLSWSLLWFLLELYSRQVDVTKAKAQLSITPECLLDCSPPYDSWACPASFCACFLWCRLGLAQWSGRDLSAKVLHHRWGFENGEGKILGAGAKQIAIQCISDLTGQFPLPWMSLLGKSLSSKRSAFRRNPPLGMPYFPCCWKSDWSFRWGRSVMGCEHAAFLLYY